MRGQVSEPLLSLSVFHVRLFRGYGGVLSFAPFQHHQMIKNLLTIESTDQERYRRHLDFPMNARL